MKYDLFSLAKKFITGSKWLKNTGKRFKIGCRRLVCMLKALLHRKMTAVQVTSNLLSGILNLFIIYEASLMCTAPPFKERSRSR